MLLSLLNGLLMSCRFETINRKDIGGCVPLESIAGWHYGHLVVLLVNTNSIECLTRRQLAILQMTSKAAMVPT